MEMLQPKLRFPEFKGDWKYDQIGNYIEFFSGIALKSEEISDDQLGVPILRGINITEGYIRHSKEIDKYFLGSSEKIKKYLVKENDLVIGMDGSKVGKNVALIKKEDENSILIQRVARIRANDYSNINFIYQHIFSKQFHDYVDIVNTSSGIPHISSQQIKDFRIGFPSVTEQTKIASFLSAVDEKLNLLTEKKAALEEYKKGMMQKIFSQVIRFKDENGKDFPVWAEKNLGEVANFLKGKGLPKSEIKEGGKFKCIHYGELFLKYNELIKTIISYTDVNDKSILSISNDILMPTSDVTPNGLATASCLREGGVILGGDILIIRQDKKIIDGHFFAYYVSQYRDKVMKLVSGSTVYHLYGSDMSKLEIVVPQIEEQIKIVNFLSSIDDKIALIATLIEDTQEYKKGLLQQMFC